MGGLEARDAYADNCIQVSESSGDRSGMTMHRTACKPVSSRCKMQALRRIAFLKSTDEVQSVSEVSSVLGPIYDRRKAFLCREDANVSNVFIVFAIS